MSDRQQKRRESRRRSHAERSSGRRKLVAVGGLTAGATLAMSGVAQAAPMTFYVGTNADPGSGTAVDCTTPSNSDCSLRQAIDEANTNADTGDTILFNSSLSGSTINLDSGSGQLGTITTGLTIQGPGASQLTIDGGGNLRIFDINLITAYQPVSISGLTMTNGFAAASGGAVRNNKADLTISNSVVSDSYAETTGQRGGGIASQLGTLTINSSTVSGNYAYYGGGIGSFESPTMITNSTLNANNAYGLGGPGYDNGYGGGVWIQGADLTVNRSTFDDNLAHDGGGVYMHSSGGAVTIRNSTIANNHIQDDGGGVWTRGSTLTVTASTVTGNTAVTKGGGIRSYSEVASVLEDSIVSGNTASPASSDDLYDNPGYSFSTSFSLIGVPSTYVNGTVAGSNLTGVDPQLGSLANNGGPTLTELPANTSPVVNKGKAFGLTTDQRGLTRPVAFPGVANSAAAGADGADMGAVELQLTTPPPPSGGGGASGPTGQRAAAKKRCKKKFKHNKKKRKKCLKRAKKLPV